MKALTMSRLAEILRTTQICQAFGALVLRPRDINEPDRPMCCCAIGAVYCEYKGITPAELFGKYDEGLLPTRTATEELRIGADLAVKYAISHLQTWNDADRYSFRTMADLLDPKGRE